MIENHDGNMALLIGPHWYVLLFFISLVEQSKYMPCFTVRLVGEMLIQQYGDFGEV